MKLSDKKRAERAALIETMNGLHKKAETEGRVFNADEQKAWDDASAKIKTLDSEITGLSAREEFARSSALPVRVAIDEQGNRHPILNKDQKLADRFPRTSVEPFSFAKMIKGLVTGNWHGAEFEQRAMGQSTLPGGGYAVPAELSAVWLDMVRAKSVCIAAGVGTLPMASQTLRVAEIVGDVVPGFRPENTAFPENDVTFGAIDLRARTIGVVARASMELLADSPMAADMIVASITGSMAVAIDAAMLQGDGLTDATHDNPKGILNWTGINAIPVGGPLTDYDHFLDAMALIEENNLTPNAVILNPAQNNDLRKLVTGITSDKTKLEAPDDYAALQKLITTGLAAGNSITGQFDQAVYGMREGLTLETTRVGADALSKGQVLIRGYMRLDTAVLRAKAFTKLTGITATAPLRAQARKAA